MRFNLKINNINTGVVELDPELYNSTDNINKPWSKIMKRIFDLVLSVIFLIFIAPWLFPLIIILIMIDSKGSPFFIQKRTGRNRKSFYCFKFRTMRVNKDANRLQVQVNDDRITRIGKFLRESHIDELPQVLNVLLGQMSIVGPRPHMLRHNVEFSWLSDKYHMRHIAKPGLTGLAQVRGFHGMISSNDDYTNRLNSDIEYIKNWSMILDIEIFLITTYKSLMGIE